MVILYLYSELVGYQIPIFKTYVEKYNAEVHVISWDRNKLKPYEPPKIENVVFNKRSSYAKNELLKYCISIQPKIVYISGWMDKGYLYVTKRLKKKGIPIVTAFDDIWVGSLRQRLGSLIFPFFYKKYFSHAWVAGPYQFEFAKRLGFKNKEIIFDMLSANTKIFNTSHDEENDLPKAFLYVGNFRKVKGVDILLKAYKIYREHFNGNWELICVGNGELENSLRGNEGITIFPFSNETELKDISKKAGIFILPSRHDQWGVVVHEFVSLGMPLLLSENVGARATFLIKGFNGFLFKNNSPLDLAKKMHEASKLNSDHLKEMSYNSRLLSNRIKIETSAANFMSIIKYD